MPKRLGHAVANRPPTLIPPRTIANIHAKLASCALKKMINIRNQTTSRASRIAPDRKPATRVRMARGESDLARGVATLRRIGDVDLEEREEEGVKAYRDDQGDREPSALLP